MATSQTTSRVTGGRSVLVILLRIAGIALLLAMAWIHFHLWLDGYQTVTTIGPLFLLNAIGGVVLAVAVAVSPARFLPLAAILSALFTAGTLGALLLSLTSSGLFGFQESTQAPLVPTTLWVEPLGVVVLVVLAVVAVMSTGLGVLRRKR